VRTLVQKKHPVEVVQEQLYTSELDRRCNMLHKTQGMHAPMRLQVEHAIFSQYHRLPGLHSEFCGLDTLMDRDETLGFEDILQGLPLASWKLPALAPCLLIFVARLCRCSLSHVLNPDPRDAYQVPDLHVTMEKVLGLDEDVAPATKVYSQPRSFA